MTDNKDKIVLNGILTYIHSLSSSRDKSYISASVVSHYDFVALKKARELLYKYADPQAKAYNGPRNVSDAEKVNHAFDSIFNKFIELDNENKLPTFACPSEELRFLPSKDSDVHKLCNLKFEKVESEIAELKKTFHSFTNIITSKQAAPDFDEIPGPPSHGQQSKTYREKVIGSVSSVNASSKRRRVNSKEDNNSVKDSDGFVYPRDYQRKLDRRMLKSTSSVISREVNNQPITQNKSKKPGVFGKSKSTKISSFKGVPREIPKAFIYRCAQQANEKDVSEWLIEEKINVTDVKLASHENAFFKSFIVSVNKKEDFDKLLTGEHLPEGIGVRRYYRPRAEPEWKQRAYSNLQSLMDEDPFQDAPSSQVSITDDPVQNTVDLVTAASAASSLASSVNVSPRTSSAQNNGQ